MLSDDSDKSTPTEPKLKPMNFLDLRLIDALVMLISVKSSATQTINILEKK